MTIIINGSGSITGATTLASTVTSPTLTTPVITSTLGVGNATPSASGAGITFPATQSASTDANTLDDYEEGTWTPTIAINGFSSTPSTLQGAYTKIGRLVFVTLAVANGSNFSISSYSQIGGLPFTSASQVSATVSTNSISVNGFAAVAGTYIYMGATGSVVNMFVSTCYYV